MSNFDNPGLYYQERIFAEPEEIGQQQRDEGREILAEYKQLTEKYRKFIREYATENFSMIYRLV